ncbi:MAG TPA: PIN domain-containing protein [Ottowia sp.]|nr:PIN domain-containing protein [Ottowia sp.]HMT65782.1 PIN domain-containing protein [Ottowia sp.]HMT84655.1 PIN domain-containing protein [Ottowia sp.]HOK12136.1 PIN domain-containing protein [Ottowia sp.]HOM21596.1 PIN domain-containing protein [Ottowia sp.]
MICFFDTNVLVYAVDAGDPARRERALNRLARAASEGTVVLSTQVLQEFYAITTRKLQPPLPAPEAAAQVQRLCAFQVMGSTAQSVQAAIALAQEHQLQWWDALILEAALRAGADVLISEDGQAGRRFGRLVVENPFAG